MLDNFQEGFGGSEQGDVAALLKAMQAGSVTGRDTTNQVLGFEPLKAESLEAVVRSLEYRTKDLKFYNAVSKMTAYNTVEEFLQLVSYGSDRGGFYGEGELSDVEDSQYIRRSENMKYIQVTGEITMQAQMVKMYFDAVKKEVDNKSMWVMRKIAKAMWNADSDIIPVEWNSYAKQHASIGTGAQYLYSDLDAYYKNSGVVVDLRGKSLKQSHIEDGAVIIDENNGNMDTLVTAPKVISALAKDYYEDQRIMMDASQAFKGAIGVVPKSISTTLGDATLMSDKFVRTDPARTTADGATSAKAPTAPTADGTTPSALVTDATGTNYTTGEFGAAVWAVSSINRYGESALTVLGTALTLASTKAVDLKFTATSGAYATNGFVIYRTLVNTSSVTASTKFYPIFKISTSQLAAGYDGAAALSVRDRGRILPDMEVAYLLENVEEMLTLKQLAPISKLDLAVISMSRRFITFMFGSPQLYMPKKVVKYINCAKTLVA